MQTIDKFAVKLNKSEFSGDFTVDLGQRQVHASDNSIYNKLPIAIIYPKTLVDLQLVVELADKYSLSLTAQGGSTATVGQSLTSGVLIDLQRYMNKILDISLADGWLEVQAGCNLKTVQNYLAAFDYYFPVMISPSDRCTIGGMIATNAVGFAGSCFGRMSNNVLDLSAVMADANLLETNNSNCPWVSIINNKLSMPEATKIAVNQRAQAIPRNIGGYDLAAFISQKNIAALFCGAEGTLGIVNTVKLKIVRKNSNSLLVLQHPNLNQALREAVQFKGTAAIELLDHALCNAIRQQPSSLVLPELGANEALLLVEHPQPNNILQNLKGEWRSQIINDTAEIKVAWHLRSQAVSLISKYNDAHGRRPLALIEDTAVPKTKLSEYIANLRKYLDSQGLFYGMYGHVDSACIHVRPALNLKLEPDLVLKIAQDVKKICESYGGVFWGEHGLGYRSEFAADFWGKVITDAMQKVKTSLDPKQLFNPGKLLGQNLVQFNQDWRLSESDKNKPWLDCNGQAACLGDASAIMCPSYRATQDKAYSPKGRAQMLHYWHLGSGAPSLKTSLDKCLGCHACVSACPVAVNIPQAKAVYLDWYYKRNRRSCTSYLWVKSERFWQFYARQRYKLCKIANSQQPEIMLFADIWTYSFNPGLWQDLIFVLEHIGVKYRILPPTAVGQSAYSEGDMAEFMATVIKAKTMTANNLPILVLEPSVLTFIKSVWPINTEIPAWHKQVVDVASWLDAQGVKFDLEPIKLLGHCSEISLQAESLAAWQSIFQQNVKLLKLGCCGMAGAFGLKPSNFKIASKLFANWKQVLSNRETILATGHSCRLQARLHGYKLLHPLEFLADKLKEKNHD